MATTNPLHRSRTDRIIGGVCGGIAEWRLVTYGAAMGLGTAVAYLVLGRHADATVLLAQTLEFLDQAPLERRIRDDGHQRAQLGLHDAPPARSVLWTLS